MLATTIPNRAQSPNESSTDAGVKNTSTTYSATSATLKITVLE